jgi:DNA-binding transcriptional ArsR family regulator
MGSVSQDEILQLHAEICAGLADPKRIMLLYELAEGPRNVTDLAAALQTPQSQISRHLKNLRLRGLVSGDRQGATVNYSLTDRRVIQALELLRAVLADKLRSQAALADSVDRTGETP